jgi:protoheme IX farnesyltransferase
MVLLLGLLAAEISLGVWIALNIGGGQFTWFSSLHLAVALASQALLLAATMESIAKNQQGIASHSLDAGFRRLAILTLAGVLILMISGSLIAPAGALESCKGWPLCGPEFIPGDAGGWLQLSHRLIVAGAGILMLLLFTQAWRTQRTKTVILVASTSAVFLFFAQALLGSKLVAGYPLYMLVLHQSTAVAIWGVLVILVSYVNITYSVQAEISPETVLLRKRTGLLKDLLMLTKPIVVVLLLVTTFTGMVIGAREWPDGRILFWTLLSGFLAAGGSGAINQYIDREDDSKMQRTQKRPIPSGRLTPAEGLAAGVAMTLTSFYLMVAFVNWLAALLTLAGIIYYVLIYSIFLKKTTVQNIVIGGGAGAIPPLVGWAAATGSLNIPSLFLFAVVFMWTPPHFWALALVRQNDYARAGVPMLPVIRGALETRWQIMIYTIELVILTLLLPAFGLGGAIYLVGAFVLGMWILGAAWKVWKQGGYKLAWKMYRYSSMYLAFLFLILMVDRLL